MKKFTRVCLITSLVLIMAGGLICVIGKVSGGFRMADEIGRNSRWGHMADSTGDSYHWTGLGGRITREIINNIIRDDFTDAYVSEAATDVADSVKDGAHKVNDAWNEVNGTWDEAWNEVDGAWDEAWNEAWDEVDGAWDEKWDDDWNEAWDDDWNGTWDYKNTSVNGTDIPKDYLDTGVTADEITELNISIGGAFLYFEESDNNNFGVKLDGRGCFKYDASEGVFYLEGNQKRSYLDSEEKVYLYIPKGKVFKDVEINVGGGIVKVGELLADNVNLCAGAGVITANKIEALSLNLEVGAGAAALQGVNADELSMNVGVGKAYVAGDIERDIYAECGMGVIELILDNAETDYNYELSCNAGNIELGGRSYSALTKEKSINNDAEAICSLDSSMGTIKVSHKNNKE